MLEVAAACLRDLPRSRIRTMCLESDLTACPRPGTRRPHLAASPAHASEGRGPKPAPKAHSQTPLTLASAAAAAATRTRQRRLTQLAPQTQVLELHRGRLARRDGAAHRVAGQAAAGAGAGDRHGKVHAHRSTLADMAASVGREPLGGMRHPRHPCGPGATRCPAGLGWHAAATALARLRRAPPPPSRGACSTPRSGPLVGLCCNAARTRGAPAAPMPPPGPAGPCTADLCTAEPRTSSKRAWARRAAPPAPRRCRSWPRAASPGGAAGPARRAGPAAG